MPSKAAVETEDALLRGRTVMITGCSSGIGASAARYFAARGAAVVLMARREERLRALCDEITSAGGRAVVAAGDVTAEADVAAAVTRAVDVFGSLDAAFNNAGWATSGRLLHETALAEYEQVMAVNATGTWNCLHHQVPAMLATGTTPSIVNTSSVAGQRATGIGAPYVAAKHAVLGLTRAAAAEYGPRGIRVNALVVGSTRTELMEEVITQTPALEKQFLECGVLDRMAEPVEIARAAAWLCSDQSSFVTGAAVPVDGGYTSI
ncbi:SDR family NAD(P)-dependent oxidoreductase [Streptomyces sp. NPDC055794]